MRAQNVRAQNVRACACAERAKSPQSCPLLGDPTDCSQPGSCPWNVPQEWETVLSSRGFSQPRSLTSPALPGGFFTTSSTREAPSVLSLCLSMRPSDSSLTAQIQDSCSYISDSYPWLHVRITWDASETFCFHKLKLERSALLSEAQIRVFKVPQVILLSR